MAVLSSPAFIVQSGGKMWCGYPEFTEHIREVAPLLADATFLVGDEEDYIDEFRIASGALTVTRVHSGCWRDVEDFIREDYPFIGERN